MSRLNDYKCRAVNKQFFELHVAAMSAEEALKKALDIGMEDWVSLGQSEFWVEDDELPEKMAPSHWTEIEGYPVSDWQYEVANNDTRQSYREWVESQREAAEDEAHD